MCVCVFYSFKGKKLSLGRILPGTPAAGWRMGSRAGGASEGTPPQGVPTAGPSETPLVWEGLVGRGYRAGWRVSPSPHPQPSEPTSETGSQTMTSGQFTHPPTLGVLVHQMWKLDTRNHSLYHSHRDTSVLSLFRGTAHCDAR